MGLPCDASELSHFHKRIGMARVEKILAPDIQTSRRADQGKGVVVDTTVQAIEPKIGHLKNDYRKDRNFSHRPIRTRDQPVAGSRQLEAEAWDQAVFAPCFVTPAIPKKWEGAQYPLPA
jgi:hypothetical protein